MRWSSRTLQVCTVGPQLGVVLRTNAAAPGTEVVGDFVAFSVPVTWTSLHSCSAPSQQQTYKLEAVGFDAWVESRSRHLWQKEAAGVAC